MTSLSLVSAIEQLYANYQQELTKARTEAEIEHVRHTFLGRSGSLTLKLKEIKNLSLEEKRTHGERIQTIKHEAERLLEQKLDQLKQRAQVEHEKTLAQFDVTAYQPGQQRGSLHPYTLVMREIEATAISMGLEVVQGPELETDFFNFEALNVPQDHPARDAQDTFWLTLPGKLMRTHTSNMQIRTLKQRTPPFAILSQGRTYRSEATDASHDFMFMQTELLLVDTHVSMGNLIALCQEFLRAIFKRHDLTIRTRPGFFPFVEPGIEIDFRCPFCREGCSVCKRSTWIELGGAGLVHPNVFTACGVDPNTYTGCAFGFGLTRLVMLKYGINDVRLLHSGSLDFLNQF